MRALHLVRLPERHRCLAWCALGASVLTTVACEVAAPEPIRLAGPEAITAEAFASLVDGISEPGGYFDTDNLISNEAGYLNVMDALATRDLRGGAYVGVGPDQNYAYIAELRPAVAFIVDLRRDNLLHHLLLKALVEMAPTRMEFLAALHGVELLDDPGAWEDATVESIVQYVDSVHASADPEGLRARRAHLLDSVGARVTRYGLTLSEGDLATIRRFHQAFMREGPSLRFTTFGRPPRPYYPTYRQLILETDVDGDRVSYLATAERYRIVRELHGANRIIPVVGDLGGPKAVRSIGAVLEEMEVPVSAVYTSNVEYYLWRSRTFDSWVANLAVLPRREEAVVIRSYFANFGRAHPSSVRGYYATQSLQPLSTLVAGGFDSYWDAVTRDVIALR